MIPKRETPKVIEERGTGSTKNAHFSSRAIGRRKVIGGVFLLVLSLIVTIVQARLCAGVWRSEFCSFWSINGPWGLFWVIVIFIGVLLIAAIVCTLRKRR
jgi:hypothetical protein